MPNRERYSLTIIISRSRYNETCEMQVLEEVFISKANAKQRRHSLTIVISHSRYNETSEMQVLEEVFISKANAKQRKIFSNYYYFSF